MTFKAQKRASGESLLLQKQFESAIEDKNISMLIWLGKQRLGQSDKSEVKQTNVMKTEEQINERLNELKTLIEE